MPLLPLQAVVGGSSTRQPLIYRQLQENLVVVVAGHRCSVLLAAAAVSGELMPLSLLQLLLAAAV